MSTFLEWCLMGTASGIRCKRASPQNRSITWGVACCFPLRHKQITLHRETQSRVPPRRAVTPLKECPLKCISISVGFLKNCEIYHDLFGSYIYMLQNLSPPDVEKGAALCSKWSILLTKKKLSSLSQSVNPLNETVMQNLPHCSRKAPNWPTQTPAAQTVTVTR